MVESLKKVQIFKIIKWLLNYAYIGCLLDISLLEVIVSYVNVNFYVVFFCSWRNRKRHLSLSAWGDWLIWIEKVESEVCVYRWTPGWSRETDGRAVILKAAVKTDKPALFAVQPSLSDDFSLPHHTSQSKAVILNWKEVNCTILVGE